MTKAIEGQLEIDSERGVIYFHSSTSYGSAVTVLRICNLPTPIPLDRAIDLTHMYGVDYAGQESKLVPSQSKIFVGLMKIKRILANLGVTSKEIRDDQRVIEELETKPE